MNPKQMTVSDSTLLGRYKNKNESSYNVEYKNKQYNQKTRKMN